VVTTATSDNTPPSSTLQTPKTSRTLRTPRTPRTSRTSRTLRTLRSLDFRVWLAFFAVYVLWGSTYLAIRVVVAVVPPLFVAGVRFVIAGAALYVWCRLRRVPRPSRLEWRNLSVLGALMFLAAYSGLFWAEQTLPS